MSQVGMETVGGPSAPSLLAQSNKKRYFVKVKQDRQKARQYIDDLVRSGQFLFSSEDARAALGVSVPAAKVALNRLAQRGLISSPARGFYVIVPPEYHSLHCLPPEQFVPTLMDRLGVRYYAGLLTAAEYHGAAHQRPQEFQVCLEHSRRSLGCGRVRVGFIARKLLKAVPTQSVNTPRGTLLVSTPEATALDLVGYQHRAGGLSQVATVLAELSERVEADGLVAVAPTAPPPWSQRLGFLLDRVGAGEKAGPLKAWVRSRVRNYAVLQPEAAREGAALDAEWKLYVNAVVEPEV
jgi:predicted transcriptional regulator of viral defense system